jgi:hypothetical protein
MALPRVRGVASDLWEMNMMRIQVRTMHVGDTSMTQVTLGFQLGGQAYSQITRLEP